jgi:acyl-CoA thioester hydrolase
MADAFSSTPVPPSARRDEVNVETTEQRGPSTIELRVRWGETDAAGIVFYPNFYVWFDVAMHELLRRAGLPMIELMREPGYGFPLVESGARFRAPVFYDDVLTLSSTIVEMRTHALRVEHRVTRTGTEVAAGFEVRAFAKLDPEDPWRLTMTPIPDEVKARLQRFTPV